jgi:type IV pilus assembly protein PilA
MSLHEDFSDANNTSEKDKGFTLVELMVVVIILGVLLAIAVPLFINAQGSAKTNSAKANVKGAQSVIAAAVANGSLVGAVGLSALTNEGINAAAVPGSGNLTAGVTYLGETASTNTVACATDGTGTTYIVTFLSTGSVRRTSANAVTAASCTASAAGASTW